MTTTTTTTESYAQAHNQKVGPPCPWCGTKRFSTYPVLSHGEYNIPSKVCKVVGYYSQCAHCGIRGPFAGTKAGADKRWKDRYVPLSSEGLGSMMKEIVEI